MSQKTLLLPCLLLVLASPAILMGQAGTSSMSMGISRAGFSRVSPTGGYMMPSPEMFRVEEFINYHRHRLPLPVEGQRVRLDLQQMSLPNGKTVCQIGITTPRALDPDEMPPMNIVLVIDRSGSMSGQKIAHVKEAIRAFIEQFRKSDKVAIVGFSNDARVHLEACDKTEIDKIARAMDSIQAGGGTNLHAGLMLGYSQALEHFDPERTNRVIFLTDGNANVGETESEEIARRSKECNKRGISLSTIGLGVDFNHGLLRDLADAGRGLIHYVGDSKDIKKTFISEIDSLLAPAARNVRLKIDFGQNAGTPTVFGYEPESKGSKYFFKLDDLNYGATQVVVARLPNMRHRPHVKATLRYTDALSGEEVELMQDSRDLLAIEEGSNSINRNYAIALVAKSIKSAAKASNEGDCRKAEDRLKKGIQKCREQMADRDDKDVERVVKIAQDYRKEILDCIARRGD